MSSQGGWGGPSVSYPTLPPPPSGHAYPDPSAHVSPSYPNSSSGSAYPTLPAAPAPVIPSLPHSLSPSAPWMASSPSASMGADDFSDADAVAYNAGGAEPYGARGTGSGSYWGDSQAGGRGSDGSGLVKVQMPDVSSSGGGSSRPSGGSYRGSYETEAVTSTVEDGVHSFRVKLLGEGDSNSTKDVLCKIGLDGVRIMEADNGRLMRIYPLDIITRWEVKEPTVFTFWVRTAVDVEQRAVRLRSNASTTTLILDTLTAACIQVFEMVGKDRGADSKGGEGGGGASQEGGGKKSDAAASASAAAAAGSGSSFAFMEWMLARKAAPQAPAAPAVEKHHWVPDEEVPKCSNCYTDFGTFVRRHHCRNCGNVFCDKCSKGRSPLTSEEGAPSVRVCDACLAEVTQRLSYEKEKAEQGGSSSSSTAAAASGPSSSSSIPSHEELMKRLTNELKRSGTTSGSGEARSERSMGNSSMSSSRSSAPPAVPPALSGMPPSSVHGASKGGGGVGRSSSARAPPAAPDPAGSAGAWLSTCSFCTAVALVSSSNPCCPTCGTQSSPPASAAAPAPASGPPAPGPQYPTHPPSYSSPSPPSSLPPHLWPSSGGGGAAAPPPEPKREVVACPTCTAHLEVLVPAVGTETLQCGVCQHPFLVGSG